MYEENGEDVEGNSFYRCPGMECVNFAKEAGATWEGKAKAACTTCDKCNGNFPIDPSTVSEQEVNEVEELVEEIADIIKWENGGIQTDWTAYEFFYQKLVCEWREAEERLKKLERVRLRKLLEMRGI